MRIFRQETKKDWIVRRLNAVPLLGENFESLRAQVLASSSACFGLVVGLWLLVDRGMTSAVVGTQITAFSAVAVAATFLLIKIFRTVYWPGFWFGTWAIIALSSQLVTRGEQASALLPMFVCVPVIFGLVVSARACAISAGIVCIVCVFAGIQHAFLGQDAFSGFLPIVILSVIATAVSGVIVAKFSYYRELENHNLTNTRKRLELAAFTDPLTGVGNRRAFDQKLQQLKMQADWKAKPALILFDVDKFKLINDTHGHAIGDSVLIELAQRVSQCLDDSQTLFRLGGDEFAIVFDDEGEHEALKRTAALAIRAVSRELSLSNIRMQVDISIGVALSDGSSSGISELYAKADSAAYLAKEKIGSCAVTFDACLSSMITRRSTLETQLSLALLGEKVKIAFQPQFDINTNEVIGFEALARWTDSKLGVMSPDEFIRIAEKSTLIDKFDRFIVSKSLEHARTWLGTQRRISINVSARSIVSSEFCAFLLGQIARNRINSDQVEVEITETVLIANWEACKANIEFLRQAGVRIVLDDFGIGYSSLSYLAQFPVQKLKFDRSFLQQAHSPSSIIVMETIVRLAKALKMEVIAEGVELPLHLTLLRQMQCQTAQGYLYSKPVMNDDMPDFLQQLDTALKTDRFQITACNTSVGRRALT